MTVTFDTINTLFPVVNFLKCVANDVVLFSVVAFKTLVISQSSVATQLRYGRILLQIFSWFWRWNNFDNRLIFGKVKAYKNCANFSATLYMRQLCRIGCLLRRLKLVNRMHPLVTVAVTRCAPVCLSLGRRLGCGDGVLRGDKDRSVKVRSPRHNAASVPWKHPRSLHVARRSYCQHVFFIALYWMTDGAQPTVLYAENAYYRLQHIECFFAADWRFISYELQTQRRRHV